MTGPDWDPLSAWRVVETYTTLSSAQLTGVAAPGTVRLDKESSTRIQVLQLQLKNECSAPLHPGLCQRNHIECRLTS